MSQGGQYDLIPAMPFAGSPLKCEHTSKKLDKSASLNASRTSSGIPAGLTSSSSLASEAGHLTLAKAAADESSQDNSDSGYVKGRVAHLEELFHKLSSEPPVEGDPATICSLPAGMLPPDAPKGTMQSFSIEDQLRAAAPPRTTPVEDLTPRGPCTSSFKRAEHALLSTTATCPSSSLLGSPAGLPPRAPAVGPSPMSSPLVHSSAYASADPPPRATSPSPMSRPISQPLAIPHAAEPSPTSSSTITSFATPANPTSQTSDLERHAQARALGLDDPEDDIFFLQRPKTAAAATAAPDSEPSLTAEAAESTVAGSISLTPPPMSSEERTGVTDHGAPTSAEASVTSKDINNVISDACSSNVQQTAVGCSGDDEALPSAASKAKFAGHPNTIYGRTFAFSSASVPKLLANAAVNASAFEVVKSSSSHTQTVDSKDKSSDTSFPAPTSVRDHVPTLSFALLANADAPAAQAQHSSLPADEGLVTPRNECSGKSREAAQQPAQKGWTPNMLASPRFTQQACEVSPSPDMRALRNGALIVPEGSTTPAAFDPAPTSTIQEQQSPASQASDCVSWLSDGLPLSSASYASFEKMPRLPELSAVSLQQVKPSELSDTAASAPSPPRMLCINALYNPNPEDLSSPSVETNEVGTGAVLEATGSGAPPHPGLNLAWDDLTDERTRASCAEARASDAEARAERAEAEAAEARAEKAAIEQELAKSSELVASLRRDNGTLEKEYYDLKAAVTQTLGQLSTTGGILANMLIQKVAASTADPGTVDAAENADIEAPLHSHHSIVRQLQEVIAASAAQSTAAQRPQHTLINSNSSVDAGLSQSLRYKMRLTSQSPTAQPQCMHSMRDTAADSDSSESSLRWTPSRSAPLSPTPSPTTHVAQSAVTPAPAEVPTEPSASISAPQTADDSATPAVAPTCSAAVRTNETFAAVVRKNLEAAPKELITCSLQSEAPTAVDASALMSPVRVSAQPKIDSSTPFDSVILSLTPGEAGYVTVGLQEIPIVAAEFSTPAAAVALGQSALDGEPSTAYMSACSVGDTPQSQSPASNPSFMGFSGAVAPVKFGQAAAGAPGQISQTPLLSPPNYFKVELSPGSGLTSTVCPTTASPSLLGSARPGFQDHLKPQVFGQCGQVTGTPLMCPPNFKGEISTGSGLASTLSSSLIGSALPGFQGFPTPQLYDMSPAHLFNQTPATVNNNAPVFDAHEYVPESSPAESSGSNTDAKLQHSDSSDQAVSVPQLLPQPAASGNSVDQAQADLSSEDSQTSSACSSDVSDSSEEYVAQKSPCAALDDAQHELASVASSASTDSHSGADKSPEVYTVWGTKLVEHDEVLVDALIMKQRADNNETASLGDQELVSSASDAYVPSYNIMQLLNERCEVFEALAEAWGNEAQVSRILAHMIAAPIANNAETEQAEAARTSSFASEGKDGPVPSVYTANLPRHGSDASAEPSYIIGADSAASHQSAGQSVFEALPESTRSNLAQLIADRSQLYAEMAAAWGQESTIVQERTAKEAAQAQVNHLEMQVATLKDVLVQHGLAATSDQHVCGSNQVLSDTAPDLQSYGTKDAEASHADAANMEELPEDFQDAEVDVYTATLPVKTAEEELESYRLQQQYAEEATAAEASEEGLMDALQVLPESTRSNLAQLLKERSQFFGAIADAWGKEAEYNRAQATAEHAVQCSAAMAQDVDALEYQLAQRHVEAEHMHKRFEELVAAKQADAERARVQCEELTLDLAESKKLNLMLAAQVASLESSDVKKVRRECKDLRIDIADAKKLNSRLAAEVAALKDELETANEKVAEVESEAARLWRTQQEDRDTVCDLRMQLRHRDDEIMDEQEISARLQKDLDDGAELIESLQAKVKTANEKADHREKAFTSALVHLRAARNANSNSPATTMVTTDTQTASADTSGTEACYSASESSMPSPRSTSGKKGNKRGNKPKGQGISNATTSRAAAAKAADAAAEERNTLENTVEEQAQKISELQNKLESQVHNTLRAAELEEQVQEVPALRDQLAASVATSKAQTERVAQLEGTVTKYRAEVDKLELALAAAECTPKAKAVTDAETEVDHYDFIVAGLPADATLPPDTLAMIKAHGNDQELPEVSQHATDLICAQVHCTDLAVSDQIAVVDRNVEDEVVLLRQENKELKDEKWLLQIAISKAASDVRELHWAFNEGQEVEKMLTMENQDLQEVVISMDKQLNNCKDQVAHLHAKEKDLRESFQMVVGDNFDLYDELWCLKGNLPQKEQESSTVPVIEELPTGSEAVQGTETTSLVQDGAKEAPKPGQKIAVLLNITQEPYTTVKVVLNQEDVALCMGEESYDTDSQVTQSSSDGEDSFEAEAPAKSPKDAAPPAADQQATEVASNLKQTLVEELEEEDVAESEAMAGDAAMLLDAKLNEVSAMLGEAAAGCAAVQGTHDMMGQLWAICTHQQAQLKDQAKEIQTWKESAFSAIQEVLEKDQKQEALTTTNSKLNQKIVDLQIMVLNHQKGMAAQKESLENQISQAHAELAQAAEELDRSQENVQALVNENLDYQDKTHRLEGALTAANKLLASSGAPPQTIEDQKPARAAPEQHVKLVVHVTDSEQAKTAEGRLMCLTYWLVQLQSVIADRAAQIQKLKQQATSKPAPEDTPSSAPSATPAPANVIPDMARSPEVTSYLPDCFRLLEAAGSAIGTAVVESAEPAEVFGSPVSSGEGEKSAEGAVQDDDDEEDVTHLHHTIMELQAEMDEVTSEKQNIEGLYDAVKAQRDKLVNQVQDMSSQLEIMRQEKEALRTHYIHMHKHAERLQQDLTEKATELDHKNEELAEKDGELAESRDMNESFTEYNDELLAENNSLTAERKELLRVRDELGDKNQELLERCARLQVTSAAAERRANAASNMLTCQVAELRKKTSNLETKLLNAKFEAQNLQFFDASIAEAKAIAGQLVYLQEQELLEREILNAVNSATAEPNASSTQGAASTSATAVPVAAPAPAPVASSFAAPAAAPVAYVTQEMLAEEVQKRVIEALTQQTSNVSEKLPDASDACKIVSESTANPAVPAEVLRLQQRIEALEKAASENAEIRETVGMATAHMEKRRASALHAKKKEAFDAWMPVDSTAPASKPGAPASFQNNVPSKSMDTSQLSSSPPQDVASYPIGAVLSNSSSDGVEH